MSNSKSVSDSAGGRAGGGAPMRVTYQGEPGANSHIAALEVFQGAEPVACPTFEEALGLVKFGEAQRAMIPIENSVAGRVADIHHLLPESGLYIIGEHFLRVHHQLMAVKGATLEGLKSVMSQTPALGQCRNIIRSLGLKMIVGADTACFTETTGESAV